MPTDFFTSGLTLEPANLTIAVFNIILAFILSYIIALTYRNTHRGLSYSQGFTFTLILIGVLIAVIMMVIGNSVARAFGAFGAFSLIRFRTAIKDSKDIAFILLVVAIGLATGTNNYGIAIVTTIFAVIIIYALTKMNFGSIRKYDYVLNFTAHSDRFSNDKMRDIFNKYLKYDNLLNVSAKESGRRLEYSFNVKFIKVADIDVFTKSLSELDGISDVDLISAKNDIEY
ncbi:MAG: hypothetical protein COT81_04670 [Candidatus Buchananbacteria bacterium CG10_big_fil_rev_8_21_14_0_10_42_9]|uniref:DUF4956 domain-containing protein n=1 Tax=Candidatus Buchananbacteria bacterium CG10_big_fil_rev_8_21_14_0_10_42_9 TaxID=1974526 RepID=A0A2H0W0C8_9BACT|nr:MAG: hypothetical protein COT81_04670 [Candidatus Buchananbacteria bacterium CG10_big_fil_rev_8_21_14_0_10_42_9]